MHDFWDPGQHKAFWTEEGQVKEEGKTWDGGLVDMLTDLPVGRARMEKIKQGEEEMEAVMPKWTGERIQVHCSRGWSMGVTEIKAPNRREALKEKWERIWN